MPFIIRKKDSEFCVYTEGADGEPKGEPHGCHATEKEAKEQQAALYVHVPEARRAVFKNGDDTVIEGMGMPFGGPFNGRDLMGEFFSGKTDFAFDWFSERPLLYHHGLDKSAGIAAVGKVVGHEVKSKLGVWVQAQLDASSEYFDSIKDLIKKGKLYLSSGSLGHLVDMDNKSGEIKRWPWVELSLTPTPANLLAEVDFKTAEKHYDMAGLKAVWTAAFINDLPDNAFAYIESGGEKDEDGKTKPRTLRHFPYRNQDGELDEAHVRNALARVSQSTLPDEAKDKALVVIKRAAKELGIHVAEEKAAPDFAQHLLDIIDDNNDLGMGLATLPLATHAEAVRSLSLSLMERTKDLHQRRIKEGRVLSDATRKRFRQSLEALVASVKEMQDFLEGTEPQTAKAASVQRQRLEILKLRTMTWPHWN